MKSFVKRILFIVKKVFLVFFIALGVVLVDAIVCYHTYYIPKAKLFVNYKRPTMDDETIHSYMKGDNPYGQKCWGLRFNFFSRHLLSARLAGPKNKKMDWVVMWPPGEIGTIYMFNTKTKELYFLNSIGEYIGDHLQYQTHRLGVAETALTVRDIEKGIRRSDNGTISEVEGLPPDCIIIRNYHWLIASGMDSMPVKAMKKAHLWHLFL